MSPRTPECLGPLQLRACAFLVALLAAACGTSSEITTGPTLVKCEVSLSASSNVIAADGGSGSVTVATNPECVWTASSQSSWISGLSPQSGQGNGSISFNVSPNASTAPREGQIGVNDAQLRVQQQPAQCQFALSPAEQVIAATGGPGSLTVTALAGCTWNATANQSWITISSGGSGAGNGVVHFQVAGNTQAARTGTISVAGQTGIVEQSGQPLPPECTFSLSSPGVEVPAAGGSGTVTLRTRNGCAWSATSTVPWVGITAGGAGTAEGVVSFVVSANAGAARTGTLTIAGQTFTVSQAALATCAFSISPTSQSIGAGGGAGTPITITTTSGCAWTATSDDSWLTITSANSGSGPGTVQFSVAANSGSSRTGTLTVAGHTFTVTQAAGVSCSYAIKPNNQSIGASGGAGTPVAVNTNSGCPWTARSNVPWITVTSGAVGSGPGTTQFTVAANTGGSRTGTLTIADETFTVTQAAAVTCTYKLNATSKTVNEEGGNEDVKVTAPNGCAWTATSNVSWIQITSGASDTGDGTVRYHVDRNPSNNSRTGTLTIAGLTFTVTQRGEN